MAYANGSHDVVLLFLYSIYLLLYLVSIMQHTWLPFQNNLFLCALQGLLVLILVSDTRLISSEFLVSILVCWPGLCDPD